MPYTSYAVKGIIGTPMMIPKGVDLQRGAERRLYHVARHLAGFEQGGVLQAADGQRVEPFRRAAACAALNDASGDERFVGAVLDVRERGGGGLHRGDVHLGAGKLHGARHAGEHLVIIGRANRIQVHQFRRVAVCHFQHLLTLRRRTRLGRAAGRAGRCARRRVPARDRARAGHRSRRRCR